MTMSVRLSVCLSVANTGSAVSCDDRNDRIHW